MANGMRSAAQRGMFRFSPLLLLLTPGCSASLGESSEESVVSSVCKEAHIASMRVSKFSEGIEDLEVCKLHGPQLTEEYARAIRDIKEVNERAADILHVDAGVLFGAGIRLRVVSSDSGFNGLFETSSDDDGLPLVTIETVDKPVNLVNRGVYAHELGHWLLWVPENKVPMGLRSLGQSHFWAESIADTLALANQGTVTSPEPGMPACLHARTPEALANRSYRDANGFFLNRYQTDQTYACCEQIAESTEYPKGVAACWAAEEQRQGSGYDPNVPFDGSPFPVEDAARNLRQYSGYQLGIPLNSFLLEAEAKIGGNILQRFLDAASNAQPIRYTCAPRNRLDVQPVQVTVTSVREGLAAVRERLSSLERDTFDRLSAAHGLEALAILEPAELELRALGLATNRLLVDGAPGEGPRLEENHPCAFSLQMAQMSTRGYDDPTDGCLLKCTQD